MSRAKVRRYFRHGLFPQLIVFEAVARLGSVTRAAEELHLAQPTVSIQLKKLAQVLDVQLFEPDGRRLKLTPAGEALLPVCGELVGLFDRVDQRLAPYRRKGTEVLRLAAEPEARAIASRLVAEFCARHPGVQASVHVAERDELLARLAAGKDDIYLFELEIDGLPAGRRWTVAQPKGRALMKSAALFVREALTTEAYNSGDGKTNQPQEPRAAARGDGTGQ